MADFYKAIEYVLVNEGGLYEDRDTGEVSNFGVSLRWLQTIDPEATADTIRHLTRESAVDLYETQWWEKYRLGLIPSDRLATKLFDCMVNCGPDTAIKILQNTLNEPAEHPSDKISVDGKIGDQVVTAVRHDCGLPNGEQALLDAFAANIATHYEEIAEKNPLHVKDLPGWLARAEKIPS